MDIAQFYTLYQVPIEILYSLTVAIIAFFIFLKVKRLYDLSSHLGIRFFGMAFFFFMLAFLIYFSSNIIFLLGFGSSLFLRSMLSILFAYSISMSGFYLVHSLVWKQNVGLTKGVIRIRMAVLHMVALAIAVLDLLFSRGWLSFLYISQLIVLAFGILISYNKYQYARQEKKDSFMQLYFIAVVLLFIGWLMNYISDIFMNYTLKVYVYALTIIISIIFLYGVIKVTGKRKRDR